jgi:hypothetical protein
MIPLYLCDALLAHPEHYDVVAAHMERPAVGVSQTPEQRSHQR